MALAFLPGVVTSIKAMIVAIKGWAVVQWLLNASLYACPVVWIIAAIAAVIAAVVLLVKNWDHVVTFFKKAWSTIKILFLEGVYFLLSTLTKFTSFIPGLGNKIKSARDAIRGMIDAEKVRIDSQKVMADADKVVRKIQKSAVDMVSAVEKATDSIISSNNKAHDARMKELDDEYIAQVKLIDEGLAAQLKANQDKIDGINKTLEDEQRADEQRRARAEVTSLRDQIAAAETPEEKARLETELSVLIAEQERERWRQSLTDQADGLKAQSDALTVDAESKKTLLKKTLEDEQAALTTANDATNAQYLVDLENFRAMCDAKKKINSETVTAITDEYKRLAADLGLAPLVIPSTTAKNTVPNAQTNPYGGTSLSDIWHKLFGAAYGGFFPQTQPVMVGERGPEVVMMPAGSTVQPNTYNTNYNVNANYSNPQQPQSIGMDLEYIRMRSRV
jgi:hypothetical protein